MVICELRTDEGCVCQDQAIVTPIPRQTSTELAFSRMSAPTTPGSPETFHLLYNGISRFSSTFREATFSG